MRELKADTEGDKTIESGNLPQYFSQCTESAQLLNWRQRVLSNRVRLYEGTNQTGSGQFVLQIFCGPWCQVEDVCVWVKRGWFVEAFPHFVHNRALTSRMADQSQLKNAPLLAKDVGNHKQGRLGPPRRTVSRRLRTIEQGLDLSLLWARTGPRAWNASSGDVVNSIGGTSSRVNTASYTR